MTDCAQCSTQSDIPYECSYCGAHFCQKHRLPEAHDCDGVEFLAASGKRFETVATNEIVRTDDEIEHPQPIDPKYTVGSRPDPDYESSPSVMLKTGEESSAEQSRGIVQRFRDWLRKLAG